MADDMNYKKMAEAIETGIARGIRKAVHQGLWVGDQKVSLTPPEPRYALEPQPEELGD